MGWGMPHPMRSPQSTPEITPRARTLTRARACPLDCSTPSSSKPVQPGGSAQRALRASRSSCPPAPVSWACATSWTRARMRGGARYLRALLDELAASIWRWPPTMLAQAACGRQAGAPHQRDNPLCLEHPGDHAAAACGADTASRIVWCPSIRCSCGDPRELQPFAHVVRAEGFQSVGSFTNSSRRCRICF
jgi:hypothetical protein